MPYCLEIIQKGKAQSFKNNFAEGGEAIFLLDF